MPLSMFQASVPVFLHNLGILSALLDKGFKDATQRKIDPLVLMNARLAPDMFPLSRQVQIAADMAKSGTARLAGVEVPSYPDTEATFPELQARIAKTIAFVKEFKASQIDGSEEKKITLKMGDKEKTFMGQAYLFHSVLPNLFFHMTTTYAILRHNGVPLGKMDFIGPLP